MTPTELPFEEIWLYDFEFVAQPGERPDVVCLAAHELRSGQTLRLWRDELGAAAALSHRSATCCSSASSRTPNAPATWRSAGRCRQTSSTSAPRFAI